MTGSARVGNVISGGMVSGPVIQAGRIDGGVHLHHHPPPPVPRQLPATPRVWVDREEDLDALARACRGGGDGVRCVAISGPGGAGKSALAVRLLRMVDADAGHAQMYVDLRGHSGRAPLRPVDVLARFLRAFGHGLGAALPADEDELAAWWRSVTGGRTVTVLADNAADADQIRPLMPGGTGGLVVVTSRMPLEDLAVEGAAIHHLRPLPRKAAIDLITRLAGTAGAAADPCAIPRVADACAHNALALRAAAARLVIRPGTTLSQIAASLTAPTTAPSGPRELDQLQGAAVVTSINQAYADLPSEAAAAVRRLGLLPARTFGPDVVAAVCAVDRAEGTRLLEILLSASLVQDVRADDERDGPLTCGFHDVIGDLAQDRAGEEPQEVRDEVLRRWVEWHLRAATEAEARLTPSHRTMPRSYRYIVTDLELFAQDSEQTVVEWLDRHRADLLAAVDVAVAAGWDELSSQIADAMWPLFLRRRHNEDLVAVHEKTLPAAERAGDLRMMRRMLTTLGGGLRSLGRYDEALERYDQALAGARRDGDRLDEAQALDGIGEVHRQAGRTGQAVAPLTQALAIREEIGYTRGAALTRLRLGEIADDNEEWHDALTYLVRARAELLAVPDPYDAARALAVLGRVYTRSGHYTAGVAQLHQAEDEFAEAGSHHWQARAREWTGAAAYNEGRTAEARDHLTAAREMYEHVHSTRDIARIDQHLLALDGEA